MIESIGHSVPAFAGNTTCFARRTPPCADPLPHIAADDDNQSATAQQIPMLQFQGFCATCTPATISYDTIGDVNRTFTTQTTGSWTLDFSLNAPLTQTINRTDSIVKLSDTLSCQ